MRPVSERNQEILFQPRYKLVPSLLHDIIHSLCQVMRSSSAPSVRHHQSAQSKPVGVPIQRLEL